MSGMTIKKRIVTGMLAGMAALTTFFAAPQKAHADYSVPMVSYQLMRYQDAGGYGSIRFITGAKLLFSNEYLTDVAIYQHGQWMYGNGYRIRKHNPTSSYDYAADYVYFTLINSYGDLIVFEGVIHYDGDGGGFADGDYGIAGGNGFPWNWQAW